jgi:hypothetical protein
MGIGVGEEGNGEWKVVGFMLTCVVPARHCLMLPDCHRKLYHPDGRIYVQKNYIIFLSTIV